MAILYIETNFLVGVALGREPLIGELLAAESGHLRVLVPSVCPMEALSFLEGERTRRTQFGALIDAQAVQLERDVTSRHAHSLRSHLQQARAANRILLYTIHSRLFQALEQLSLGDHLLGLTSEALAESCRSTLMGEPTDNLILHVILGHARSGPPEPRAFVSGNHKDFERPEILKALGDVGVEYFRRTRAALDWLRARSSP